MKIWKRALSVGLSALMVAGCALPALAAEDIAEKSETVYVVLEPDGSVRIQSRRRCASATSSRRSSATSAP